MENVVYDRDSGQLLTGSCMRIGAMPRADDMGTLTTAFSDVPCRTNPIGIGAARGESGADRRAARCDECCGRCVAVRSVSIISTCRRRLSTDDKRSRRPQLKSH